MAQMNFDGDGLLKEPCISCDKCYMDDLFYEWHCDEKECPYKAESDDCISRQWLMECINEGWIKFDTEKDTNRFIHLIRDMAPPVTQRPKTGHWINDKCSICGKGIEDLIDSREWYKNETPNYCPFCGKRVIESEES